MSLNLGFKDSMQPWVDGAQAATLVSYQPMVDKNPALGQRIERAIRRTATIEAVAEACDISVQGVYKWFKSGQIARKHLPILKSKFKVDLDALLLEGEYPDKRIADDFSDSEFDALLKVATPRSRDALSRIAAAVKAGSLSEADIALLEQIANRFLTPQKP